MRIGRWKPRLNSGRTCLCGQPATYAHAVSLALAVCDACAYESALAEHSVRSRREGNQVIASVPYTDASGSTGVEEIHITSPAQLQQVLGY